MEDLFEKETREEIGLENTYGSVQLCKRGDVCFLMLDDVNGHETVSISNALYDAIRSELVERKKTLDISPSMRH